MIQLDEKLYRGPRPKSFKDLAPYGITTVINLEYRIYDKFHDDKYEHENPADFGITVYSIPCSDFTPPTKKQVQEFLKIVSEAEGLVYVHCLHQVDRTGFMCAVYRMRVQGWSFKDAVKEMFDLGFHKFPYLWWLLALRTFA